MRLPPGLAVPHAGIDSQWPPKSRACGHQVRRHMLSESRAAGLSPVAHSRQSRNSAGAMNEITYGHPATVVPRSAAALSQNAPCHGPQTAPVVEIAGQA